MKLKELLPLLENEINNKINKINELGKTIKELEGHINDSYASMKDIALELKYVLPIVKEQYPETSQLFETLLKEK